MSMTQLRFSFEGRLNRKPWWLTNIAVGIGVSTGAQAAESAAYADGVIVGSALIRAAADGPEGLDSLARDLHDGVRSGTRPGS